MTPRRLVFFFLGVLTALRLALIAQFGLFPDEAYYFMWSERMDWSFFSKGPGVAVTIWLSTHLFGASEFGVRFFSPLLALGTSLVMWQFARRLYSESIAAWLVLLLNVVPIFNAGALVMTIDPLSIFFWAAALATCWRAIEESPAFSWWWSATGALIGLGFLAKYTNAMQLVSIALLLALTPKYRGEFKRPGFYAMLAMFLACCTPIIVWNAQHDWVTLDHLTARGGLKKPFALEFGEFGKFLLTHFGVYSPLIFGAMLAAVAWAFPKARHSFKVRYLLAFTLPLFALYFWLSLKQAGEANWTAPSSLSLALLAVALWHERAESSVRVGRFALTALAIGAAMSLALMNTDLVRATGVSWAYARDPSSRMRGWQSAAAEIERFRDRYEAEHGVPVFLIANEHEVAASLGFYLGDKRPAGPGHPPIYIPAQPYFEDQFSFWPRYDQLIDLPPGYQREDTIYTEEQGYNPFKGHTALYITDRAEVKAPSSIKDAFEQWEMIACIDQTRRGQPLRQLRIFVCTNYLDPGVK
ncbi:MAG: glycosyltransferase family 39 protein [Chthoniobacteraceae bacterium]